MRVLGVNGDIVNVLVLGERVFPRKPAVDGDEDAAVASAAGDVVTTPRSDPELLGIVRGNGECQGEAHAGGSREFGPVGGGVGGLVDRSEERRVGKEGRDGWSVDRQENERCE